MTTTQGDCIRCGSHMYLDEVGSLVDDSGSDVCGASGGQESHQLDSDDEILGLAILDVTGISDHVPGMPDFL